MRALRLEAVGRLALREAEAPVAGPGEVLVRVEACGICGTDRHLYRGEFPSRPPVTPGHEFAGIVEAVGEGVARVRVGDLVTGDPNIACGLCPQCRRGRVNLCEALTAIGIHRDGGFAERTAIPEAQAHVLPPEVGPERGAFCEPLACTLHGVDLAGIVPGMAVTVLGGGVIGLLAVQLARLAGAEVTLVTRSAAKRDLARELGAQAAEADGAGLPGGRADVVLECAGVPETVRRAPGLARAGGTVVLLGVLPQGEAVAVEPFDLVFREVRVLGSFVNPFTHARAAGLIAAGAVRVDPLVSRRLPLGEAAEAIAEPARPGEVRALVMPQA